MMPTIERVADLAVKTVVRVYPSADRADLRQEAVTFLLGLSLESWDPQQGAFAPWAFAACRYQLARYALRQHRPASASDRGLRGLRGTAAAPLEAIESHPDPGPSPAAALEAAEVGALVRAEVCRWPLAAKVFLDEAKPREVAAATGRPAVEVYRSVDKAKRELTKNEVLRDCWSMP